MLLLCTVLANAEEVTPGGSTVHRYSKSSHPGAEAPEHAGLFLEEIESHLGSFLGEQEGVYHEIVSDRIHVDILLFGPNEQRPFWTLVTSGMSDLPMLVPSGVDPASSFERAELVISLPHDWLPSDPIESSSVDELTDERWWPIGWLKFAARFPHEYNSWLWAGHSIPNGDPPEPLGPGTGMTGIVLAPPMTWPNSALVLQTALGERITFLAVYPIYTDEMELKLNEGADVLFERLLKEDVSELLDANRPSVAGG